MRLLRAGFEQEEVGQEVARLEEVGLLDDARFAAEVVEHAVAVRRSGRWSIVGSLAAKGVARATIERALEGVTGDEEARAAELAASRVRRLAGLPPETAFRRLSSFLVRRGYDAGAARRAAAAALGLEAGGS